MQICVNFNVSCYASEPKAVNLEFSLLEILNLQSNLFIGKPKLIVVSGGVKCLATVGIHYVDLANILFKNRPVKVNANLNNDFINPRNASLSFYEGVFSFSYPGNRILSITYSNK